MTSKFSSDPRCVHVSEQLYGIAFGDGRRRSLGGSLLLRKGALISRIGVPLKGSIGAATRDL